MGEKQAAHAPSSSLETYGMDRRHGDASSFDDDHGRSDGEARAPGSDASVIADLSIAAQDTTILEPSIATQDTYTLEPPITAQDTSTLEPPIAAQDTSILEPSITAQDTTILEPPIAAQPPTSAGALPEQPKSGATSRNALPAAPSTPYETPEAR